MKKHNLVAAVGTLALVANLLLPSLAFGQNQTASQTVGCPTPGTQTFAHTPVNTTLTPLTAGVGGNTIDTVVSGAAPGASVQGDNLLAISDTTSGGANGCSSVGGSVTASATDGVDPAQPGTTIDNAFMRLVTTPNVTADLTYGTVFGPTPVTGGDVIYNHASGPGDDHDVTAPQTVANPATAALGDTSLAAYRLADPAQNLFGAAIDVLRYCTPKNSTFGTDVLLALDGVSASQPSGTYTFTITYLAAPLNCISTGSKTLTTSMGAGETISTITLDSTASISVGTVLSIGAEYVTASAVQADGVTLTVARAQLGTTAVGHNSGSTVSIVGTTYAAALQNAVTANDTTFTVTSNANYSVGQTVIVNDVANNSYEHVRVTAVSATNGTDITVERGVDNTVRAAHPAGTDLIAVQTRVA